MRYRVGFVLLATLVLIVSAAAINGEEKQPVYVGARVCAACHEGRGMGHQYSRWLLSKHAQAYAVLALPSAKAMAELSGIPGEPQETMACLGCHATAADAEAWEKDPTFRVEDGVQCERCHGPGSEYIADEIMRDREAATAAGLRFLSERECELCHYEKGSHVAIHHLPQLDLKQARETIAHPAPASPASGSLPEPVSSSGAGNPDHAYVGVAVCADCHGGPDMGYQFSLWRLGPHARAYAVLASPRAFELARAAGVDGEPQQAAACLACHTTGTRQGRFGDSYSPDEGVGCEACHGAGGDYVAEAVMRDPRAAAATGLKPVTRETCMGCHEAAHGKPFDYEDRVSAIAHPTRLPERSEGPRYKTPVNLALSPDGKELYVACEASDSVVVVDTAARRKLAEIDVGRQPNDVAFSPDGSTAYVSNRLDDSVSAIDVATREVKATIPVGDEPHGLLTDRSGRLLYVLNTAEDSISVIDTTTQEELKRLSASRNPWSLSMSPDGTQILVTNNLSGFVGVAWHPSGDYALVTMNRTKNLVPMTRIVQGWTITNGLGILWRDGRVDQILLDEPNLCFPDAADVAVTPDGRYALVTSSGSDRVAVVDLQQLESLLQEASTQERERIIPNHLGLPTEFVVAHVPTTDGPRGILIDRDGRTAYTTNALDDSLTVIDLEEMEAVERIDLGGPREITGVRRGEKLFHSANISFQRQFSCHSCHPDGHVDGITYDIEPDGIGFDPVDNRSLRGILDTAPFKWTGKNPSLPRQCGPRLAVFFTRIQPFTPDELTDLENYISTIPRPPNRHRPLGADLTEAQRRGKKMFERAQSNDGGVIPVRNRCVTCHFPPLYTDRSKSDVGTKMWLDRHGEFDVPHLTNIYDSAPYLHNGISETLEEIWTRFNPNDEHGVTNDMTKDQLNDLIEYLKTL